MTTGGEVGGQKGKKIREQTGNYCNYCENLKGNKQACKPVHAYY